MCLYGSPSKNIVGLFTRSLFPIKSSVALMSTEKATVPQTRQTTISQHVKQQQETMHSHCCCNRRQHNCCIRFFSDKTPPEKNIYEAYWDEKAESKRKNSKNPTKWASPKRFDDIYRQDDVDKPKRVCRRTWTEFREPIKRQDVRCLKGGVASEMALRPKKVRYFTILPPEPQEMDLD